MTKVITISELIANIRCRRNGKTFLAEFVNRCEAQNAVIIPPNATNGDVLTTIFPNLNFTNVLAKMYAQNGKMLLDWWNAPYEKGESE